MTQDYFCSQCGKQLDLTMQFCPQCGKVIAGSPAEAQMIADQKEMVMQYHESRMSLVSFLLAIYAVPALIFGIAILLNADVAANTIFNSEDFRNMLIHNPDLDISLDDIRSYFTWIGWMCAMSGIAGIVSLVTIIIRKYWIVSSVACFISTVLCIWSIFGFIIGLFVSMMILSAKDYFFKDYAIKLGE